MENCASVVAIVGAGLIGRAWAAVFARAGWTVRVTDPDGEVLANAPQLIVAALKKLERHGLVNDPETALSRVRIEPDLGLAVADAALVQENGPENAEIKSAIFRDLDAFAPSTAILASSSSAIVASRFCEGLAGRSRCLVAHPVNPPHLVPLVELCGAPWTSQDVICRARAIYESVGQTPVVVNREIEGFVLNRLQGALLAEAFRLVGDRVMSPEDVDKTMKDGLGLRWSFLGPFETIELNAPGGIEDYCARYSGFYRRLSQEPAPPDVWDSANLQRVVAAFGNRPDAAGRTERSVWRDDRLAALRAHKHAQGEA